MFKLIVSSLYKFFFFSDQIASQQDNTNEFDQTVAQLVHLEPGHTIHVVTNFVSLKKMIKGH